jgi:hypothetical protein
MPTTHLCLKEPTDSPSFVNHEGTLRLSIPVSTEQPLGADRSEHQMAKWSMDVLVFATDRENCAG